jgi:hypothetical protein
MGGYYSEPVDNPDDERVQLQHMMFGVNCYEKTFDVHVGANEQSTSSIMYLEPVDDTDDSVSSEARQLAEQMVRHLDLSSCRTIIELGSSVVSLVAARYTGATKVVAYDIDETRLRILQHADTFMNNASAGGTKIQTKTQSETTSIAVLEPTTDLVVVTKNLSEQGRLVLQDAMDRRVPIVATNYQQLQGASYRNGLYFLDADQKLKWK